MRVSPRNILKNLSFFDVINNFSGVIRGLKSIPATRYKKFSGGRDFIQRGQPSNLPLKYSPGGRPLGMETLGMGDPNPVQKWGDYFDLKSGPEKLLNLPARAAAPRQKYTQEIESMRG